MTVTFFLFRAWLKTSATRRPNFPSPIIQILSFSCMIFCSMIRYAAAYGSTNTAWASGTWRGTLWRFFTGNVMNSAKQPSLRKIPKQDLFGQWFLLNIKFPLLQQISQLWQLMLISPTTRLFIQVCFTAFEALTSSTTPTNSCPKTPLNPSLYPSHISISVRHIPARSIRMKAWFSNSTGGGRLASSVGVG